MFLSLKRLAEKEFGCGNLRTHSVSNFPDRKEKVKLFGVPIIDNQILMIDTKIEKIKQIQMLTERETPIWNMHFGNLVWSGKTESNLETMTMRDTTTEKIEITIDIVRVTRGVALIETANAIEIVESRSTSQTPPHLAKKKGIATDHKPDERLEAVLEDQFSMAPTAVEEDLRVRAIFPLQMNEGGEAHVIRMFLHRLPLLSLDLLIRFLL